MRFATLLRLWLAAARDQVTVNFLMGHVDSTMAGTYREGIEDKRLLVVTTTCSRVVIR